MKEKVCWNDVMIISMIFMSEKRGKWLNYPSLRRARRSNLGRSAPRARSGGCRRSCVSRRGAAAEEYRQEEARLLHCFLVILCPSNFI